ncbi:metal ABC transporter permease [Siminovitchia sediminis]|uniref:Metal ABC transporter permease n=1 Tax=Siminovitchia sediminis TaxID=1274353 RepID=A0ABW4KDX9_9BACI
MAQEWFALLTDANTRWVLFGTMLLGITSGVLGSFALLRKQSLIGDAMAHAALPGVCIAFILHGEKSMPLFLAGAALAGLLAAYFIQLISKQSRIKEDTAIGLTLSVFFGFGIVLLTRITQAPGGNKSGLNDFIFGKAAALVGSDVQFITGTGAVLLLITLLFFKEFKLLSFDPQFAQGIGMPVKWMNGLLMVLIVGAVVIGIQAVGVVLMSAMLITPAIAARYWTDRLSHMIFISGAVGGFSGVCGTLLSTQAEKLATGPIIVVAETMIFLFSLLLAPRRGLLAKMLHHIQVQKETAKKAVLISLYELYEETNSCDVPLDKLMKRRPFGTVFFQWAMKQLKRELLIKQHEKGSVILTEGGLKSAYQHTLNQRLYEVYLMHEREFALPDMEDKQFDMEKISPQLKEKLQEKLRQYGREPLYMYRTQRIKERNVANEL